MDIQVWSLLLYDDGAEVEREDLGVKNMHQLKDWLVNLLEISDDKWMRIEAAMNAGEEFRVFDDEGTFVYNDEAMLLVPLTRRSR